MADSSQDTVAIPKSMLGAMLALLVVSLLGFAFLLGRQTAPGPVAQAPLQQRPSQEPIESRPLAVGQLPPPSRPAPIEAPEPVVVERAPAAVASLPVEPADQVKAGTRPKPRPKPVAAPTQQPVAVETPVEKKPPAEAAKIRAYLSEVEAVTEGTGKLGDPSEFATSLIHQSLMGDTSGIDQLIQQVKEGQAKMAKIQPPTACLEHHRLASGQLKGSLELLVELKQGLVTSDHTILEGLSKRGRAMQGEAQRLQKITEELKKQSAS